MITLYMKGTATTIDGASVDYIVVDEDHADTLIAAGWVKDPKDLNNESN